MNRELADKIADATLYEGYVLYPYRPSVKNQQRWTFGGVYPRAWSEANPGSDLCEVRTEVLAAGKGRGAARVVIRFLQLIARTVGKNRDGEIEMVQLLEVGEQRYRPWQEAMEREMDCGDLDLEGLIDKPATVEFGYPAERAVEEVRDAEGKIAGVLFRNRQAIQGVVEISAEKKGNDLCALSVKISNLTSLENGKEAKRDDALMRSLVSMHVILGISGAEFVSMTDVPAELRKLAEGCRNTGLWPVLIGSGSERDTMLASPIILYDYPQLAPESPGDLFDGTEIDEILTLRILTLTDEENREAAGIDPKARDLLARSQSLAREQLMNLHGTMREMKTPAENHEAIGNWNPFEEDKAAETGLKHVAVGEMEIRPGDRVRLRPLGRADIFDMALDGKIATVISIERDFEDRIYLAVTVEDDPGKDLGVSGKPGHRFFFGVEEIEPIADAAIG